MQWCMLTITGFATLRLQGTSRQISVTFARSTSVDSSFTSPAEEKEKKKPAAGGGGLALAMVYAAKLGCYFIVQVRYSKLHRYSLPCAA